MNTTTLKIINVVEQFPNKYTMAEIGRIVDMTRERVRQIVKKEELHDKIWHGYYCSSCGKRLRTPNKSGMCRKCWINSNRVEFNCDECGKLKKTKRVLYYRFKLHFCNKICQGRYTGKHWGWQPGQLPYPSEKRVKCGEAKVEIRKVEIISVSEIPAKNQWR